MTFLTIKGNKYNARFTLASLKLLQKYYKKSIDDIFNDAEKYEVEFLIDFLWACMFNDKDFRKVTNEDFTFIISEAIEEGEIEIQSLSALVKEVIEGSVLIRNLQQQAMKQQEAIAK